VEGIYERLKKKKSLQLAPVMVKMPMPAGILGANGDGITGRRMKGNLAGRKSENGHHSWKIYD